MVSEDTRTGEISRPGTLSRRWSRFWMRFSSTTPLGRLATRLAVLPAPPHYAREYLARFSPLGYVSPSAVIHHSGLRRGSRVFIDDRCLIYQNRGGGTVSLGDNARIYRDVIIETGAGGYVEIGDHSSIHPRCQLNGYLQPIRIGSQVMIAANCALYSYDHGVEVDQPIHQQPLQSRGPIVIEDEAWLGTGVIVLSGVTIGRGAVIGAGSVVTRDVPENGIAVGNPARLIKLRGADQRK